MRKTIILASIFSFILIACTKDDNTWKYGDKQELAGSEWLKVEMYPVTYVSNEGFSPIRNPKEQTLRFEDDGFTMTTKGSVHDDESQIMRDTIILTHGRYEYEHPTLRLTPDSGSPSVEAWISPLNRICFHDNLALAAECRISPRFDRTPDVTPAFFQDSTAHPPQGLAFPQDSVSRPM